MRTVFVPFTYLQNKYNKKSKYQNDICLVRLLIRFLLILPQHIDYLCSFIDFLFGCSGFTSTTYFRFRFQLGRGALAFLLWYRLIIGRRCYPLIAREFGTSTCGLFALQITPSNFIYSGFQLPFKT